MPWRRTPVRRLECRALPSHILLTKPRSGDWGFCLRFADKTPYLCFLKLFKTTTPEDILPGSVVQRWFQTTTATNTIALLTDLASRMGGIVCEERDEVRILICNPMEHSAKYQRAGALEHGIFPPKLYCPKSLPCGIGEAGRVCSTVACRHMFEACQRKP